MNFKTGDVLFLRKRCSYGRFETGERLVLGEFLRDDENHGITYYAEFDSSPGNYLMQVAENDLRPLTKLERVLK